jgi:hypothetical protein
MAEIPYTVRLAPELLERIEKVARLRGIAPRKLVRAALAERFGKAGEDISSAALGESNRHQMLNQILFDLTRTRLTLQHLLDNQVGSEVTDQIRQTAETEAAGYMRRLGGVKS